jgi:hypothetical protein
MFLIKLFVSLVLTIFSSADEKVYMLKGNVLKIPASDSRKLFISDSGSEIYIFTSNKWQYNYNVETQEWSKKELEKLPGNQRLTRHNIRMAPGDKFIFKDNSNSLEYFGYYSSEGKLLTRFVNYSVESKFSISPWNTIYSSSGFGPPRKKKKGWNLLGSASISGKLLSRTPDIGGIEEFREILDGMFFSPAYIGERVYLISIHAPIMLEFDKECNFLREVEITGASDLVNLFSTGEAIKETRENGGTWSAIFISAISCNGFLYFTMPMQKSFQDIIAVDSNGKVGHRYRISFPKGYTGYGIKDIDASYDKEKGLQFAALVDDNLLLLTPEKKTE